MKLENYSKLDKKVITKREIQKRNTKREFHLYEVCCWT